MWQRVAPVLFLWVGLANGIPGQPKPKAGVEVPSLRAFDEAHQISANLDPDGQAIVLQLLLASAKSTDPERVRGWAIELFNVGPKLGPNREAAQKNALVPLSSVDPVRAAELFPLQKTPDPGDSEDNRIFAAEALFPALWSKLHTGSLNQIESLASWMGSTGEYPYTAIGDLALEVEPVEPAVAQELYSQAVHSFEVGATFPLTNKTYVEFLLKTRQIPSRTLLRKGVQDALDAIDKSVPLPSLKGIRIEVQTKDGTRAFGSEKDYLLARLLPLIREIDESWFASVLKTHPTLKADDAVSEKEAATAVGAIVQDASTPQHQVREALDTMQISRAERMSGQDPKAAFALVNTISTPELRDIGMASVLPNYVQVEPKGALEEAMSIEKRIDRLPPSPAKLQLEVKMTDALFALKLNSEATARSRKAIDLGTELFRESRLSNPHQIAVTTIGFDELVDLAQILGHWDPIGDTAQQIRGIQDGTLRGSMLAFYGRGLAQHETHPPVTVSNH